MAIALPGFPMGKKAHKRGRKSSGNPLNHHNTAHNQAHAKGDFKTARMHALNYAKLSMGMGDEPETSSVEETESPPPTVAAPPSDRRAQLAKLTMSRKK